MARILLADDDAAARELVARALSSAGHTVEETQDGSEALDKLLGAESGWDLLVTDAQMPALDGVTLAGRALAASADLKIVVMSGYTSELDRATALGDARLSVIAKPFSLEQIRAVVQQALG